MSHHIARFARGRRFWWSLMKNNLIFNRWWFKVNFLRHSHRRMLTKPIIIMNRTQKIQEWNICFISNIIFIIIYYLFIYSHFYYIVVVFLLLLYTDALQSYFNLYRNRMQFLFLVIFLLFFLYVAFWDWDCGHLR